MKWWAALLSEESATTSVEYSLMLTFIMAVVIGSVALFGNGQNSKWLGIGNTMRSHGL